MRNLFFLAVQFLLVELVVFSGWMIDGWFRWVYFLLGAVLAVLAVCMAVFGRGDL